MKLTVVLIALVLLGLLTTRTVRSVMPCGGRAVVQVWDEKPGAFVLLAPLNEKRGVGVGKVYSAPSILPPVSKTSDASEIQAVRDLYAALISGDPVRREEAFVEILPVLLALNPDAVGYMAETWERGAVRAEFLQRTAMEWAKLDWMSCLVWAANLQDRAERVHTLTDVSIQVSRDDTVAAIAIRDYFGIESRNAETPDITVLL